MVEATPLFRQYGKCAADDHLLRVASHLLLLLPGQLHLLLLFFEKQGGHVPLLGVGAEELFPKSTQLVDHHQQLELLLRQGLGVPCWLINDTAS